VGPDRERAGATDRTGATMTPADLVRLRDKASAEAEGFDAKTELSAALIGVCK
jgi:hypothetical protein